MQGLFGDDDDLTKRKGARLRALPLVPETGWRKPEYPNLRDNCAMIGVDTETYDPELQDAGAGWARGRGHIIGVSLAAVDHWGNKGKWYLPIRHEEGTEDNLDEANTLAYLRHTLGSAFQPKVFAHAQYDLGWLGNDGVEVAGQIHDVQYAEALIDNNARIGLDIIAKKYLGLGKNDDLLEQWVMEAYKPAKSKWKGQLYRTPPKLVGPYAEDDAALTLDLLPMLGPLLDAEGLTHAYYLECDLIPMLIAMRRKGTHVDVEAAHKLKLELDQQIIALYEKIANDFEFELKDKSGEWSTHSNVLGRAFDYLGVSYPRTKAGNPSVEKEWLDALDHPIAPLVLEIRESEKMSGTFIQSYILDKNINGQIYPTFVPMKNEDGGTMVYRFASNGPNLQNIPSRTKLGKRVRKLFKPDPGHALWRKHDYSQIHYRILAHFAVDNGDGSADALRQAYINDPNMDYHFNVYQNVAPLIGWETNYTIDANGKIANMDEQPEAIQDHRRIIKNVNFSGLYGVGEKTLAFKYLIGMDKAQVKQFLVSYHQGAPYIDATTKAISAEAQRNGYVETLLGRRIRFVLWEPMAYRGKGEERPAALPYDLAVSRYGSFIQLAYLYRAVNYKFQGSEPDIMKTGMLKLWKSGVLDYVGVPRLTVHDELDWSQTEDSPQMEEAFRYVQHVMQGAIQLRVPVKVDMTKGATWGEAK